MSQATVRDKRTRYKPRPLGSSTSPPEKLDAYSEASQLNPCSSTFWKRSPASFSQHWVSQKRRPYLFHLCFFQSLHLAHFAGTHEMVRWCFKKMLKWCSIFSARPGNFPQHLTVSTWPETPGKLFPEISPVFHPHSSSSNGALSPPHCPGWRTMELQEQVQKPPCVKASL